MPDSTRTSSSSSSSNTTAVPPTSHRFMAWTALCLCSLVALASHVSATTTSAARQTDDWFVVIVCSISASAACLAILGYAFVQVHFKGGIFEGLLAVVSILTWICGMPVIMSPDRNIAVSKGSINNGGNNNFIVVTGSGEQQLSQEFTFIRNANMYFFSWACTICVVYICGRLAKEWLLERRRRQLEVQRQQQQQQKQEEEEARKKASAKKNGGDFAGSNNDTNDNNDDDKKKKKRRNIQKNLLTPKTNLWYLLTLTSLVVLVDAVELYMAFDSCSSGEDNEAGVDITGSSLSSSQPDLCTKTEYAVALGAVGTFCAFICSGLATTGGLGTKMECVFAMIFLALYLAGVALITFNEGPGTSLGNLYFATWMGAIVGVVLVGRSYRDVIDSFRRKDDAPSEEDKPKEDPVEFPDIEMGDPNNKDDPAWAMVDSSPAIAAIITNADGDTEIEVPSDNSQKTNSKDEEDEPRWSKVNQSPKEAARAIATLKEQHDDSEVEIEYKSPTNKDKSDDEEEEKVKETATKVAKVETESDSKSEESTTDEPEVDAKLEKKAPVTNKAKKRMSSKKKPSVKKIVEKETEKSVEADENAAAEKEKEEVKTEKKAPVTQAKKRMSKKASSKKVVDAETKADTKSQESTVGKEDENKAEKKAVPPAKPPAKKRVSKKTSGNSAKSAASSEPEAKLKRTNSKNAVKSSEPEAKTSVQSKMEATPTKASTNPFADSSSDLKKETSEEVTKAVLAETKKAPTTKVTTGTKSDPDEMKDGAVVAKEPKGEVKKTAEQGTASAESENQNEE